MPISTDAVLPGSVAGAVLLICVIIAVIVVVILCIARAMHSSKYRVNTES